MACIFYNMPYVFSRSIKTDENLPQSCFFRTIVCRRFRIFAHGSDFVLIFRAECVAACACVLASVSVPGVPVRHVLSPTRLPDGMLRLVRADLCGGKAQKQRRSKLPRLLLLSVGDLRVLLCKCRGNMCGCREPEALSVPPGISFGCGPNSFRELRCPPLSHRSGTP